MSLLTPEVIASAERSVLCWLATVSAEGWPNVSPKEIFAVHDAEHLVVAQIASPATVRNLRHSPKVCLSFVDVFVQKGFKVLGEARYLSAQEAEFANWAGTLLAKAGPRFPLHGVIVIRATAVEPIVAPSYRLYPDETSEQAQIESALKTYGVRRA